MSVNKDPKKALEDKVWKDQFHADLGIALQSREMRRVLWTIMEEFANIHEIPPMANADVYFINGRRYVGLVLKKAIEAHAPERIIQMQQEAWELEKVNSQGVILANGKLNPIEGGKS